jgi:hypothetical protein
MRSIPAALTWETFDRSRWSLPAAALGALAFPVLILSALSREGAVNADDRSMLIMHLVMVQMNLLIFGSPLVASAWKMSRLYPYPASNATLVTWRLAPIMIATFVETAFWTAALNLLFDLDWPLWGPALLSAVTIASVLAAAWLTAGSRWIIFAITVLATVLSLWFKSRYGGMFSNPIHHWATVTPGEIFTMLLAIGIVWRIAVAGVARSRRGEPPFSLGVVAWLDRLLDRGPSAAHAFRSSTHAQFWYEWRNGWVASTTVVGILLVCLTIWLFSDRNSKELVSGVLDGAGVLLFAALINGLIMGNVSRRDDLVMGHFLATRPLTSTDQALTILRAAAASLLLAWAFWGLALTLAYGICAAVGDWPSPLIPQTHDWRQTPAIFAGSWILMTSMISVILTGRGRLIVRLVAVTISAYVALAVFAKYALPPEAHDQAMRAVAIAASVALVVGTITAFIAARRRGLVAAPAAWAALAVWAAVVIVAMLALPPEVKLPPTSYILLVGLAALAVAPLAAAPLALAWNRHR